MTQDIRELGIHDIDYILDYFLNADVSSLEKMGVTPQKLPLRDEWYTMISSDLELALSEKQLYYLIWEIDGTPVGHSNINKIEFGKTAHMHLHMWDQPRRKQGSGAVFIEKCVSRYFERFNLKTLFCEPMANNPGPNKTVQKLGFDLIKTHETTPGWINYHQTVNLWCMTRTKWLKR